jgi:TonB family protein
MDVVNCLG